MSCLYSEEEILKAEITVRALKYEVVRLSHGADEEELLLACEALGSEVSSLQYKRKQVEKDKLAAAKEELENLE